MSYTNVFGGNTIYPSDVSLLAISLSADTPLEWPLESSGTEDPAARIIEVTPSASGFSVILPDATLTGAGQTILFNNVGVNNFFVKDFAGGTLATIAPGEQWQVYLAAVTTAAGTWRVFRYGASTATVQPSALAGFGLIATDSTLSQALPVTTFSTSGITLATSNRATAFIWTGTGAGTLNLLTAASAGNNFFVFVRNEGGGDLTVAPIGTETINSAADLVLRPGDSATVITDGISWFTIGFGQQAVFAFDYTSITVTGGDYTLTGSELNRISYKFVGALTDDVYIIIPSTVQQYWINNATNNAFNFFVQTNGGPPTQINQGAKGIYYCDGTNIILASDPTLLTLPIVVSDGGTGATTASAARLNLGVTTFADPIVTATDGATVRTVISAAASGANSDITSLSGLTTPISIAQGGTNATTAANARTSLGLGSMATQAASSVAITGGTITGITDLAVADGGTGASTAAGARANLGAQETLVSAVNIKTINGSDLLGSGDISTTGGNIPTGTKMLFIQSAAPTGWTKSTTHNNKALRIVSGTASSGGTVAFTDAFTTWATSGTVNGTALSEAQLPSHTHQVFVGVTGGVDIMTPSTSATVRRDTGGNFSYHMGSIASTPDVGRTSFVGSGSTHTHSFTGGNLSLGVQYVDAIIATKD